jgi:hypothetical protein
LSRFVRDDTNGARDECGGNRRSAVEKIARPLTQASHLLVQAGTAVREKKLHKKLTQTRRAVLRAEKQLAKRRATLSPACLASFDPTIGRARTGLSCLP